MAAVTSFKCKTRGFNWRVGNATPDFQVGITYWGRKFFPIFFQDLRERLLPTPTQLRQTWPPPARLPSLATTWGPPKKKQSNGATQKQFIWRLILGGPWFRQGTLNEYIFCFQLDLGMLAIDNGRQWKYHSVAIIDHWVDRAVADDGQVGSSAEHFHMAIDSQINNRSC